MSKHERPQAKLADVIEQRLQALILEGTLRPGEKLLPERELAKKFEVSRSSLREALLRLEAKKLVERRQGGGTFVKSADWQEITDPLMKLLADNATSQLDLLETRYALEGIAAYFAALRATDEDIARLKSCHQVILSHTLSVEIEAIALVDYLVVLVSATHNAVLLHLVNALVPTLRTNIQQILALLHQKQSLMKEVDQHRVEILEAIEQHHPEKARDASNRHLAFIQDVLVGLHHSYRMHSLDKNDKEPMGKEDEVKTE